MKRYSQLSEGENLGARKTAMRVGVCWFAALALIIFLSGEAFSIQNNDAGLLAEKCTLCHGLDIVSGEKKISADWRDTLLKMRVYGTNITDEDLDILLRYLSSVYGATPPAGLHLIGERCTWCHNLERLTSHRMTPADWESTVNRMRIYGANLTNSEAVAVLEYLSKNFPAPPSGAELIEGRCVACHGLEIIKSEKKTREGWKAALETMRGFGTNLTEEEANLLLEYLSEVYGTAPSFGAAVLEQKCTRCHSLDRIISQKKTVEEWKVIIKKMAGYGANLSDEEASTVLEYLTSKFTSLSTGPSILDKKCAKCHALSLITAQKNTAEDWGKILDRMIRYGTELTGDEKEILHHFLSEEYGVPKEKIEVSILPVEERTQEISMKAAYNDTYIFFQFEWKSDEGKYHDYLVYRGGKWVTDTLAHEDMLSIMLDDGGVENFPQAGCFVACHSDQANPDLISKYLLETRFGLDLTKIKSEKVLKELRSKGDFLDLWNWRASSTNPIGYADDQEVFRSREGDEGEAPFYPNWDEKLRQPKFMYDADKTGFNAFKWSELKNQKYYYLSEDLAVPFNPVSKWEEGATIPTLILKAPAGSRSDVRAKGEWKDGKWVLELMRKLNTGNPTDDKTVLSKNKYTIAISMHNNSVFRAHYVSFPISLGLGTKADLEAMYFSGDKPKWNEIQEKKITLFIPGNASWEVATAGAWHPFTKLAPITGSARCVSCHVEPRAKAGLASCQTCMSERDIAFLTSGQQPTDKWWYSGYSEVSGEFSSMRVNEVKEFRDYVKGICGPTGVMLFAFIPSLLLRALRRKVIS